MMSLSECFDNCKGSTSYMIWAIKGIVIDACDSETSCECYCEGPYEKGECQITGTIWYDLYEISKKKK